MQRKPSAARSVRHGILLALILALAGVLGSGPATQSAQQATVQAFLLISNDNCQAEVRISQLIWMQDSAVLKFRFIVPAIRIPIGETEQLTEELSQEPSAVQIGGAIGERTSLSVTAHVGTTQYQCGLIQLSVKGQPEEVVTPMPEELPPNFPPIRPDMSPEEVVQSLRSLGYTGAVRGSRQNPKVGGVDDPLLIRELQPGPFFDALFATSGTNTLRAAVAWDEPATPLALLVFGLGVPGSFCLHYPLSGGITAHCDRPQAQSAAFTWKVPSAASSLTGSPFFVLVFKLGGPANAYVLSLAP